MNASYIHDHPLVCRCFRLFHITSTHISRSNKFEFFMQWSFL